jgi:hypothetical protein
MVTPADNTATEHRSLHFDSIDDVLAEIDRIVAADRAGMLRRGGNWTPGQAFSHLAAWIEYGYEGYPFRPPWFVRVIGRLMAKSAARKPMRRGFRIPGVEAGTYGVEEMTTDEGAARLKLALQRLKDGEPPRFESPALGPMSMNDRIGLNLRHAELHLGFLHPA